MIKDALTVRNSSAQDCPYVADIFSRSRRLLTFVPERYSVAQDRWFIDNVIYKESEVHIALRAGAMVSFLALQGDQVRLLHTAPEAIGQGAGRLLLEHAKQRCPSGLHLWCFQKNTAARRFYERHGFVAAEFTDGQRNEEKEPDILYRWAPS